jgi:hypothetical protein
MYFQALLDMWRKFIIVPLISKREDDGLHPTSSCCYCLLLDLRKYQTLRNQLEPIIEIMTFGLKTVNKGSKGNYVV